MSYTYSEGVAGVRSGVYQRYSTSDRNTAITFVDGRVAAVVQADSGATDEVTVLTSTNDIKKEFGTGGTTDVLKYAFLGGATEVYAIRLEGKGATKGTAEITTGGTGAGQIVLTLKAPGARKLSYQLKKNISQETKMDWKVLENGEELETFQFDIDEGQDQVTNFLNVIKDSKFVDVTSKPEETSTDSTITEVASAEFQGGKDGEITTESYSQAFEILGRYRFNTLALDTVQADITALAKEFTLHQAENGRYAILVVGTQKDTDIDARIAEVKTFDDHNVVAVGPGYVDVDGNKVDEYLFAAQIAGMIAGISSRYAITGKTIQGAVKQIQQFTNDEYIKADQNGLVTITVNDLDEIEVELGVTTLTTLKDMIDDKGWQKIKRVKTRNEMFQRINLTLAPYKGNLEPDENSKTFVRGKISQVLDGMVAEKKISPVYSVEVTDEIDNPNAFCYQIVPYDYDAVEQFYLHYIFRYKE